MVFYYTSDFEKAVAQLCKKKKDGYTSCITDIKDELRSLTIEQLWELPFNIYTDQPLRIIKTRIPNSHLKLGKSSGFRLIFIVNVEKDYAAFLFVYPKQGKHAIVEISDNERNRLLANFIKEFNNEELRIFEMNFEPALTDIRINS